MTKQSTAEYVIADIARVIVDQRLEGFDDAEVVVRIFHILHNYHYGAL